MQELDAFMLRPPACVLGFEAVAMTDAGELQLIQSQDPSSIASLASVVHDHRYDNATVVRCTIAQDADGAYSFSRWYLECPDPERIAWARDGVLAMLPIDHTWQTA